MSASKIDYQSEAEALLKQPEGSLPPLQMLDRLHRYGVWSRGNINPRGSLTAPADALLNADLMKRILSFVDDNVARDLRQKALLAVGQWGGEESLAKPIKMLESDTTDSETRFYCLSPIRTVGGPEAVAAIAHVLKSGGSDLLESAINAILDLATGGSASDIDSPPNARRAKAACAELSSALIKLSERKSLAFNLRYRVVDTLEYLKEIGLLVTEPPSREEESEGQTVEGQTVLVIKPKSREVDNPNREKPLLWNELDLPLAAGEPEVAPDLPPGTIAAGVEFDPPIQAQGRTGEMHIALLPIEDEYKDDVTKISEHPVYQTKQGTIMVVLQAFRHELPQGVSRVCVKARGADGKPIDPVDDQPLEVGGASLSFQFRVSDPDGLADPPQFMLTKVE